MNTTELYNNLSAYMRANFVRKVMVFLDSQGRLVPDYQCQQGQYITTIELVDILDGIDCFEWIINKSLEKRFGKVAI